jgi:hypothetical protein
LAVREVSEYSVPVSETFLLISTSIVIKGEGVVLFFYGANSVLNELRDNGKTSASI